MTPLAEKIPTMTDADLKSLRVNAARLLTEGSTTQVATAEEILPLIDAQLAVNAAAPKAATPIKKRAVSKKLPPVTGHQTALPTKAA